jgi:hypothetical protein
VVAGVSAACRTSAPLSATGVPVVFVDEAGAKRRGALEVLWSTGFEHVSPVRSFGSFRGQRSFQGSWWFATTGEHVGFESWVERDAVMLLDFDPDVIAVSSQPFCLMWAGQLRTRRHVPDFFARLADGSALVIDVRPDELVGTDDAEVFAATRLACAAVGWGYRRVGVVDAVLAANVRWLSGFRHRRCGNTLAGSELVRRVAAGPVTVTDLVAFAGDRLAVLPTLYHLLWRGVLAADLAAAPLSGRTVVRAGRA